MRKRTILVVDDEKNTRLSLEEALRPLGFDIVTAANGDEALEKLEAEPPALMLLDLLMPGIDGMQVLERTARAHPEVRVIIITAHGSIENAIEAMKLGAADFIQKPFSVDEIRVLVSSVLDRERLDAARADSYRDHVELAKRFISDRHFDAATEHVRRAIAVDSSRPEAFNLLGVLRELAGDRVDALKNYRIALEMDPGYKLAQQNLARATRPPEERRGPISFR